MPWPIPSSMSYVTQAPACQMADFFHHYSTLSLTVCNHPETILSAPVSCFPMQSCYWLLLLLLLSIRIEGSTSWDFGEIDPGICKKAMPLPWAMIPSEMWLPPQMEAVFLLSTYMLFVRFRVCLSLCIPLFCKSRFRDMLLNHMPKPQWVGIRFTLFLYHNRL